MCAAVRAYPFLLDPFRRNDFVDLDDNRVFLAYLDSFSRFESYEYKAIASCERKLFVFSERIRSDPILMIQAAGKVHWINILRAISDELKGNESFVRKATTASPFSLELEPNPLSPLSYGPTALGR